jgi:glycosyltransferase involved in cell wall biosynthesis
MKVIFYIPDPARYKDRILLLREISNNIDDIYLIIGVNPESIKHLSSPHFHIESVYLSPGHRLSNMIKIYHRANQLIKRHNIEIIHDTFGNFILFALLHWRWRRIHLCASFFSSEAWRIRNVWMKYGILRLLGSRQTITMFYGAVLQFVICHLFDAIIVQAPGLINRINKYTNISIEKFHVLSNNVDTTFWCPGKSRSVPGEKIKLLFVGGIDHSRGVFLLLDVITALAKNNVAVHLTLIGTWGSFARDECMGIMAKRNLQQSLTFCEIQPREKILHAMRENHIFIYQTINDGSPRCVFEACSAAIPVIASHHPGIDIIDPSGEFIHFTDFGDTTAIIDQIDRFRKDPLGWYTSALTGRQAMIRQFDTLPVAQKYCHFYQTIVDQL